MKKDDLDQLEKSQEIQQIVRFSKEQYEREKLANAPVPFSDLMQAVRKSKKDKPKSKIAPWWLAAACLLGWIVGYGFSGKSVMQSDKLAVTDTLIIMHERVDTIYREVRIESLVAVESSTEKINPKKEAAHKERTPDTVEPIFSSPALILQELNLPDPESECYAANGMSVNENDYPLHLLTSVPGE